MAEKKVHNTVQNGEVNISKVSTSVPSINEVKNVKTQVLVIKPEINTSVNMQLRSEEVQDILSKPPKWMIRWGNSLLISLIVLVLILCYLIKYPDVISGKAIISTETPPVYVESRVTGRIDKLIIPSGQFVSQGDVIAEIESPVSIQTITYLSHFLISADNLWHDSVFIQNISTKTIELHDASTEFLKLKSVMEEYVNFLEDKKFNPKLNELISKRNQQQDLKEITLEESAINKKDVGYAQEKFLMLEKEYKLGFITKLDFINAQTSYNQSLKTKQSIRKNILQANINITEYENQIRNFKEMQRKQSLSYQQQIRELVASLKNYIIRWENDYTIRAPNNGRLEYMGRVKEKQLIDNTDVLFAIIPDQSSYEVEVEIPFARFGKVKKGQIVKLKLDNFPHTEYGTIEGRIKHIPTLPDENGYTILVSLPNNLTTSYGISLQYSPEMTAQAEIITADLRLIERFFHQILSLVN